MYRNRARAAHVLQPSAPVVTAPGSLPLPTGEMAPPGQVPEQYPGYPTQPGYNGSGEVPFFNPLACQNGHMEPPAFSQDLSSKGI